MTAPLADRLVEDDIPMDDWVACYRSQVEDALAEILTEMGVKLSAESLVPAEGSHHLSRELAVGPWFGGQPNPYMRPDGTYEPPPITPGFEQQGDT